MEQRPKSRAGTIAVAVAGLVFLLLYLAFVARGLAPHQGPGDRVVGDAFATLAALAALWALLLTLIMVDQIRAKGPAWGTRPAILLVPIAAIATFCATDYPGQRLCVLSLGALPLIVASFLVLGWLPDRTRVAAGRHTRPAVRIAPPLRRRRRAPARLLPPRGPRLLRCALSVSP